MQRQLRSLICGVEGPHLYVQGQGLTEVLFAAPEMEQVKTDLNCMLWPRFGKHCEALTQIHVHSSLMPMFRLIGSSDGVHGGGSSPVLRVVSKVRPQHAKQTCLQKKRVCFHLACMT